MAAPSHQKIGLRVLELYSGIGGLHYGLQGRAPPLQVGVHASGLNAETIGAVDINDLANKVYRHNFPDTNLMQRSIEGITQAEFIKFDADMLLMSPPCQPFTRQGLKGDSQDARTRSFFYVMDMLPRLSKTPTYILVENVKGFETSNTRNYLVETLEKCDFSFEEFLVSPVHLGIPNQRLRYFLLAKKRPLEFTPAFRLSEERLLQDHRINVTSRCQQEETLQCEATVDPKKGDVSGQELKLKSELSRTNSPTLSAIDTETPIDAMVKASSGGDHGIADCSHGMMSCNNTSRPKSDSEQRTTPPSLSSASEHDRTATASHSQFVLARTIEDYLEDLGDDDIVRYLLPDKVLLRYAHIMDIVTPADGRTMCFTKGYGHKVEGSGSVLQTNAEADRAEAFSLISKDTRSDPPSDHAVDMLRNLRLRYFTPKEIAGLHHLPKEFSLPSDISLKQCYRVLGNSLNAYVVSVLLHYLTS